MLSRENNTNMDRPSRKTKLVNYSDCMDLDDDEDFASVKAPPSKRTKECVKEPGQEKSKKPSNKSSSQETGSQLTGFKDRLEFASEATQDKRKPLDVKLYERDLEAALTLSLLETALINGEKSIHKAENNVQNQPQTGEYLDPSLRLSNCSVDVNVLGLDQITNDKESPSAPFRPKKTASKNTRQCSDMTQDDNKDYQPKETSDSESDADFSDPDESDDEFTVKKPEKKKVLIKERPSKKEKPKGQTRSASKKEKQPLKASKTELHLAGMPNIKTPILGRSPTAAKPAHVTKRPPTTPPVSRPAVSGSPAGGRIPKWNPPGNTKGGQVGRSPGSSQHAQVTSPGQGLRLGLSRNVRVKPLHPNVAIH
ncbi:hypothetical protein UPYG_G00346620 [Umbra pygmaea]|uniref:RAD51 interacting motif domain-containing protein n=1 Tax=Umbra pygmaea TaxID=75934 RepID=A0ABD0VXF4_UMBPY